MLPESGGRVEIAPLGFKKDGSAKEKERNVLTPEALRAYLADKEALIIDAATQSFAGDIALEPAEYGQSQTIESRSD